MRRLLLLPYVAFNKQIYDAVCTTYKKARYFYILNSATMMQITITLPTGKANKVTYHVISFEVAKFDEVTDLVSTITTFEQLRLCSLWTVL